MKGLTDNYTAVTTPVATGHRRVHTPKPQPSLLIVKFNLRMMGNVFLPTKRHQFEFWVFYALLKILCFAFSAFEICNFL